MALNIKTFSDGDLTAEHKLIYTHNLNTESVAPTLYDDNGIQLITSDNFAMGDEIGDNKANVVTLTYSDVITGTHKLLLVYQSAGETTSGRRAFELAEATPTDDYKVILGKELTPSINMTLTNFFALLLTKLGFLKKASNLGDLTDSASARTNLGVYSAGQVDTVLATKATLYQTGSGAVMGVGNTAVYNPTSTYNPATKKYADDYILFYGLITGTNTATQSVVKYAGSLTVTCVHLPQEGKFHITHNKGDMNYIPDAITAVDTTGVIGAIYEKTSTQFKLSRGGNYDFYLTIYRV